MRDRSDPSAGVGQATESQHDGPTRLPASGALDRPADPPPP